MLTMLIGCLVVAGAAASDPFLETELIFEPDETGHGHVHASCIVECPNGDLRAVWYENGTRLPGFWTEDRDKSDDVRIGGARKPKNADRWEPTFVMADTFGVSDNNPCMVIDKEERLWLVYGTLVGVPESSWGSSLVRYHVASEYDAPGPPKWDTSNILVVHPNGFKEALEASVRNNVRPGYELTEERLEKRVSWADKMIADPFKSRFGWMPRAHPLVRSDGTVLLPLANENFGLAAVAMTNDGGDTWTISKAVPQRGLIQPTLVAFSDGHISAFFRNSNPAKVILRSESEDGGMTWSATTLTDRPHPGSGIEAILLANGHLLMIYNDNTEGPRDQLAVSISEDRGKTWRWTRHLEDTPGGRFDYPSIVQGEDGTLHASYSFNTKSIKYAHFNEAWVQQGD